MSDERRMCQVVIDFIVIHSENLQISICSMLWIPSQRALLGEILGHCLFTVHLCSMELSYSRIHSFC